MFLGSIEDVEDVDYMEDIERKKVSIPAGNGDVKEILRQDSLQLLSYDYFVFPLATILLTLGHIK